MAFDIPRGRRKEPQPMSFSETYYIRRAAFTTLASVGIKALCEKLQAEPIILVALRKSEDGKLTIPVLMVQEDIEPGLVHGALTLARDVWEARR